MKRLIIFIFLSLMLIYTPSVHSVQCPFPEPEVFVDYIMEPYVECIYGGLYYRCAENRPIELSIRNHNCYGRILIYVSADGTEHELTSLLSETGYEPKNPEEYLFHDIDVPQEIGAEWIREMYFKDNPNERIKIIAKNLPGEKGKELYEVMSDYCRTEMNDFGGEKYRRCVTINFVAEFEDKERDFTKDYTLYYVSGAIILISVILFITLKFKKKS